MFDIADPDNSLYFMITLRRAKQHFKGIFFWAARIPGNSLQLSIRISNNTGSLYFFTFSHCLMPDAWMGGYIQTQNKPKYNFITSWNPIPTVQHDVVNIDILYKFVEHPTVKRTSLHPPIHGTVKGTWKNWIYICSSFLFQVIWDFQNICSNLCQPRMRDLEGWPVRDRYQIW